MSDSFGMMDAAYFVGRVELLNWLNDLLQLGYTKVEQTCSGAAHCQVMDAVYPGKVPLHKVNFNAKFDYEYVKNYKVLQDVFTKLGVDKYIDVQKLIKGKYQDNLEFLQWMKKYYDLHHGNEKYNAVERRMQAKVSYDGDKSGHAPSSPPKRDGEEKSEKKPRIETRTSTVASKVKAPAKKPEASAKPKASTANSGPATTANNNVDDQKVAELNQQVTELKLTVDGLEKERDFYFQKLREVEILCQSGNSGPEILEKIQGILYATDDQNFENAEGDEVANLEY
eukprot:TRINITY_DN151_c0_g2_i1.p1 TRINITY_DN151_c0_g2~~TRINITY_DN151_c0_g2_i1.p1  ORF type:complete len:283 (+),score=85.87 TRINITY_DN151_c0_g2_i1:167-1015(+)